MPGQHVRDDAAHPVVPAPGVQDYLLQQVLVDGHPEDSEQLGVSARLPVHPDPAHLATAQPPLRAGRRRAYPSRLAALHARTEIQLRSKEAP